MPGCRVLLPEFITIDILLADLTVSKTEGYVVKQKRLWRPMIQNCLGYLAFLLQHFEILGNQFRIPKAASRLFAHGLCGHLVGQCGFVGAGRAKGIVDVNHLQNAGQHWYLGSPEAVRIARSVGVLVVMTNDRQHETQRVQRLADIFARDGVKLHDLPLFRSEVTALFEDVVGNRDLAEIVEISAAFEREDGIFVHVKMASKIGCVN